VDYDQLEEAEALVRQVDESILKFKFRDGQNHLMNIARLGNKYFQDAAPWHAIKEDDGQQRVEQILNVSLRLVQKFAAAAEAFLPETSSKIKDMLQTGGELMAGKPVTKPVLLFDKIEDEAIEAQLDKLAKQASDNKQQPDLEPIKDTITFDDFVKLDLRIGTIKEASKVKKADKLLQLSVDIGLETRTILSGIAEHFAPEELVGKQAVVVCNLAPRKMRGVESNGMLLMAENTEGKLVFVQPETEFPEGSIVR
jgi:methionyl-tRNA synthetase